MIEIKLCIRRKSEFVAICKAMVETVIVPDFITVATATNTFSPQNHLTCIDNEYSEVE